MYNPLIINLGVLLIVLLCNENKMPIEAIIITQADTILFVVNQSCVIIMRVQIKNKNL